MKDHFITLQQKLFDIPIFFYFSVVTFKKTCSFKRISKGECKVGSSEVAFFLNVSKFMKKLFY